MVETFGPETSVLANQKAAGADLTAMVRPDPEVVAKAKRRKFTAKYKQEILTKADKAASEPGAIGARPREKRSPKP